MPVFQIFTYRRRSLNNCVGVLLGTLLVVVGYIVTLIEENLTSKLCKKCEIPCTVFCPAVLTLQSMYAKILSSKIHF